jgi:salicylate hydroxylase
MKAIVVGAGIGGLTAALTLQQAGIDVTVIDQAPAFGDVGAGIQLAPNATRVLESLGLLGDARRIATQPAALSFRSWSSGKEISRNLLGPELEEEFGTPLIQIHRADLHQLLVGALRAEEVVLSAAVTSYEQDAERAWVIAGGRRFEADLVVAADGVRSQARRQLFGSDEAVFSGNAAYRFTVPSERLAGVDLPENASWIGPHRHFVHYWVRGGSLLNVVAVVEAGETAESWTAEAAQADVRAEFEDWNPLVTSVIDSAETVLRYGLYVRTPLERWSEGRITLLGDSAHAMVPFQAQGAAQAIVDARALGDAMVNAGPEDVPASIARYVQHRIGPATSMQLQSSRAGDIFHLPDGPLADKRNASMAAYAAENKFAAQTATWRETPPVPAAGGVSQ